MGPCDGAARRESRPRSPAGSPDFDLDLCLNHPGRNDNNMNKCRCCDTKLGVHRYSYQHWVSVPIPVPGMKYWDDTTSGISTNTSIRHRADAGVEFSTCTRKKRADTMTDINCILMHMTILWFHCQSNLFLNTLKNVVQIPSVEK